VAEKQMYKEEMDRLGFASGGWFKKLAALGSFFDTVADAAPAPPRTEYENLQDQANKKYKDRPADKEMFDVTTNYLMEQKDRNIQDAELGDALAGVARNYSNVNPIKFIRNYPIKEIELNYDNIKTQYERTNIFHENMIPLWQAEEKKRNKLWTDYKSVRDSPETLRLLAEIDSVDEQLEKLRAVGDYAGSTKLHKMIREPLWDEMIAARDKGWAEYSAINEALGDRWVESTRKIREFEYGKPRELKATPLSEQDIRIYAGRIKDPEHRKYTTALLEDSKRQFEEREAARLDPNWRDPKLSNISGDQTNVQPAILAEIDRVNLSKPIVDSPYRRWGFKPAWDIDKQELTSTGTPFGFESDEDAYVYSSLLGRERLSPTKWLYNKVKNLVRGGKLPIQYLSFTPDQMYSLLGESDQQRILGQMSMSDDPYVDRTEWDDPDTKTHELLHRYFKLAEFNKDGKFFGGDGNLATEEFFVRAYTKKIYGEDLNEWFWSDLQSYLDTGGYSNYNFEKAGTDEYTIPMDLTKFRKKLPAMIERFEKAVAGKDYDPEFGSLALEEILVTAPRQQGYAPPPKQSIKAVEEKSLLSRGVSAAKRFYNRTMEQIADHYNINYEGIKPRAENTTDALIAAGTITEDMREEVINAITHLDMAGTAVLDNPERRNEFIDMNKVIMQGKEFPVQFFTEGPIDSMVDIGNNYIGFRLGEQYIGRPEEFKQAVVDTVLESLRRRKAGERFRIGKDVLFYEK